MNETPEERETRLGWGRRWRENNPEKCKAASKARSADKAYWRLYRYGITEEQYQAMLKKQKNACAICRDPFEDKKVCVDHCHDKKTVRGLLCDPCNQALGKFKDSVENIRRAATYLQRGAKL